MICTSNFEIFQQSRILFYSVLPPMSLHLFLGAMNLLCDMLELILEQLSSKLRAQQWYVSCSVTRDSHYGGKTQFNGPQCHKLLANRHKLVCLVSENELLGQCKPILNAFDCLHDMVQSCFGMVLYPRYSNDIRKFADSIFNLINFCDSLRLESQMTKLNVIPKFHAIFVHIKQFFDLKKETHNLEFGLAFYCEQA